MDRNQAEKLIRSGSSSPGDVAVALLWLRHLSKGARGKALKLVAELDRVALAKVGLPAQVDGRRERSAAHVQAIYEGRVQRQMERLRAVLRSDHPFVTVKEQHPTHWEAAHRLCRAGEADTWALVRKRDKRRDGDGRQWWTITRSEEDERI